MSRRRRHASISALAIAVCLTGLTAAEIVVRGQGPLAPGLDKGLTVTPAFEGWYENPDGTFSLSFGYYNRNLKEEIDVPIGPNNKLEPGNADQGQPTHFEANRHWGVFTVTVPKDFGKKEITWTLVTRGQSLSVPGNLKVDWKIDAIAGDANGNTPPFLKFASGGPEGQGPRGVTAPPMTASVGAPLTLTVWGRDDAVGRRGGDGPSPNSRRRGRGADADKPKEPPPPFTLTWVKHRGPGTVTFDEDKPKAGADGNATTTAKFSEPGEYVLRVLANDVSGEDGGNQCCWTNGFVRVSVRQ